MLRFCAQRLGTGCSWCVSQRGVRQRDVTGNCHVGKGHRARAAAGRFILPS